MKISQVLDYMNCECVIRNDSDYSENVDLSELNADWHSGQPSNEDFHAAAIECQSTALIRSYETALQSRIDDIARAKSYMDGFACASYASSTNPIWKQEALDFIAWRDACWQYAYDVQAQVAGAQDVPTIDDFIANAPTLNW